MMVTPKEATKTVKKDASCRWIGRYTSRSIPRPKTTATTTASAAASGQGTPASSAFTKA